MPSASKIFKPVQRQDRTGYNAAEIMQLHKKSDLYFKTTVNQVHHSLISTCRPISMDTVGYLCWPVQVIKLNIVINITAAAAAG